MNSPGANVLLDNGKRGLSTSGKSAVFNAAGECASCCGGGGGTCTPHIIAAYPVHEDLKWDISEYQNNPIFTPNSRWRLVCYVPDLGIYCIVADEGDVDENGIAVGLPKSIVSGFEEPTGGYYLFNGCSPNDYTGLVCGEIDYNDPLNLYYVSHYLTLEY